MNGQCGLPVTERREFLRPRHGNGRIARNDFFNQPAHRFKPKRQGNNVEQQPVVARCAIASEQIGLGRSTKSDDFVRIKIVQRLLLEKLRDSTLNLGHPSGAADHDHPLDIIDRQICIA